MNLKDRCAQLDDWFPDPTNVPKAIWVPFCQRFLSNVDKSKEREDDSKKSSTFLWQYRFCG